MSETTSNAPLTVVLVHGAFADSSSWKGVIGRLQAAGIEVTTAPNPLRGISHDAAYVAGFIKQVPGPRATACSRRRRSRCSSCRSSARPVGRAAGGGWAGQERVRCV